MGSGSINTPQFFRCKIKYDAEQTRQSVIEKLSVKVYRKLAFLLQKFPSDGKWKEGGMLIEWHNGRARQYIAGKNSVYNPKHNDRRFDIENSEHIDVDRANQNIYWDCCTGFPSVKIREYNKENDYSFEKIEQLYYFEHYADHIHTQNERNEKTRHTEHNRIVTDLLTNNKTCPEESIYQIGTIDESVSREMLAKIAREFFTELKVSE